MSSSTSRERPVFWRCDHCGTPNPAASYILICLGCGANRPPEGTETDAGEVGKTPTRREKRGRRVLIGSVIVYGLIVLAASLTIRLVGDAWWPALVLLTSPRWAFLIPALPLAVVAWRWNRPFIVGIIAIEILVVLGPLMGFRVPWTRLATRQADGPTIRVMTLNRGGGSNDVPRLVRYLERNAIDVVCFQEFQADPTLDAYFDSASWHRDSTRSIASRYPIVELPRAPESNLDRGRYTMTAFRAKIEGPGGKAFVVASIHLPTLRPGVNRLFAGDLDGLRLQADWWNRECARMVSVVTETDGLPTLVAGDFNMPVEANALASLLNDGVFQSAFDEVGWGWGYTRPSALPWVRIDHIFATTDWKISRSWVGPDFGSDHRCLVAEVAFPSTQPVRP